MADSHDNWVRAEGGARLTNSAHHLLRECVHTVGYGTACTECQAEAPAPFADLAAALRKMAEEYRAGWRDRQAGVTELKASAFDEAADLVAADPLYKAAPGMRRFIEGLARFDLAHQVPKEGNNAAYALKSWQEHARRILAALPKEGP